MGAGDGRAQGSGLCLDCVGVYRLSLALVFSLGEVNRGVLVGMLQAFPRVLGIGCSGFGALGRLSGLRVLGVRLRDVGLQAAGLEGLRISG